MISADEGVILLKRFSGWFGPPLLKLYGQVIDGRVRQAAMALLPSYTSRRIVVPTKELRCRGDAAALLMVHGHPDRALEYLSPFADDLDTIALETRLPKQQCRELLAKLRASKHVRRQPAKHHHHARRVARIRKLLDCTGDDAVPKEQIEQAIQGYAIRTPGNTVICVTMAPITVNRLRDAVGNMAEGHSNISSLLRAAVAERLDCKLVFAGSQGLPPIAITFRVSSHLADAIRKRAATSEASAGAVVQACAEAWLRAHWF
jgi:hypothetical protein